LALRARVVIELGTHTIQHPNLALLLLRDQFTRSIQAGHGAAIFVALDDSGEALVHKER